MNSFGQIIRLTTFGESHGPAMGGILDGMPSLVRIDPAEIQRRVDARRPGVNPNTSQRREPDRVELLSGISDDGFTLGTPIGFIIRNVDANRSDYDEYSRVCRPNHADFTYKAKYGIREAAGGGRASARETVSWVVAGAVCRQWLDLFGISIEARFIETLPVAEVAAEGDSTGGIVACTVKGMPVGVGEPVFDKLHARLAYAMMSINAAKAFEYGDGFAAASMRGSESLDLFLQGKKTSSDGVAPENTSGPSCATNHSGGVQGGISNGNDINFKVYFKPTPTLRRPLQCLGTDGENVTVPPKGRHDPCVAIRAVPVVEAMAALTVADLLRISGILPKNP